MKKLKKIMHLGSDDEEEEEQEEENNEKSQDEENFEDTINKNS